MYYQNENIQNNVKPYYTLLAVTTLYDHLVFSMIKIIKINYIFLNQTLVLEFE